ncbi:AMP-binding protein [Paenibacillus sp. HN-1]|uniref:AMP-binding protein n=1 Tax=Paenibacillus TaxID=44249 RepID=UPI001CA995F5|nr:MULTISPECIES: AMP-binding protein [Paenibacillus]MBY9081328.1 AMP-binding protein [Paenibacillus sp. CGMCC 1.18879]MBY9086487.1 AMP-binding protein [Paenibacillus sinensis]
MDLFNDLNRYEDNIAIIDENENSYTYHELFNRTQEFKSRIPEEKKVLILIKCKNTVEAVIGYLGGIAGGHAVMLVDNSIDSVLLDSITKLYQPEYIWQPEDQGQQYTSGHTAYELVETGYHTEQPIHPDLSLVMLTSGSTGSPKGVRLTRANINANAKSISEYLELTDSERPITTLPMNYVYGLSVITSHLYVGATILLVGYSVIKKDFWGFFKKHNATSISGVPYTYEMLRTLRFFDMELPSLRYFTQAGGRLGTEQVKQYSEYSRNKGIRFFVMYGQTEATARISYLPPEYNLAKSKSIGVAIPGGRLYLNDQKGRQITTPDVEGVLYYEGPNVMLGYANDRHDLAKGDEQQGCLNTHDTAYFDEDGFFYVVGRNSRFIKILGKRVSLDEIEHYLWQKGFDCAIDGYDDLLLIAVTNPVFTQKIREIIIKTFKIDYDNAHIFEVEEIKKNSSGKVQYKEIFSDHKIG